MSIFARLALCTENIPRPSMFPTRRKSQAVNTAQIVVPLMQFINPNRHHGRISLLSHPLRYPSHNTRPFSKPMATNLKAARRIDSPDTCLCPINPLQIHRLPVLKSPLALLQDLALPCPFLKLFLLPNKSHPVLLLQELLIDVYRDIWIHSLLNPHRSIHSSRHFMI